MTIQEAAEKFQTSPDFAKLSYDEQMQLKAKVLPPILKEDPTFLALNSADRSAVFQKIMMSAPKLEDPELENQMNQIVQGSQSQDLTIRKQAQDAMTVAVTNQSVMAGSLMANVAGWTTAQIEKLAPGLFPHSDVDQLMGKNPKDVLKMAQYFESQIDPNSGNQRLINFTKVAAPIVGNLLDWSMIGGIVGSTAEAGTGLGRLAMAGSVRAAENASTTAGRMFATLGKAVSHAALTATIGTARENALEILKQGEVDPNIQHLLINNAKWFGGYFLGDTLFNTFLDIGIPTIRSMKQIFIPKGQVKEGLVGLTENEINNKLLDLMGGRELSPVEIEQMGISKGTYRAMQAAQVVNQNVAHGTAEDFTSLLLAGKHYTLTPLDGGGYQVKSLLEPGMPATAGNVSRLKFADLKSVQRWFMQSPANQTEVGVIPASGAAAQTWKDFRAGKTLTPELRLEHQTAVEDAYQQGLQVPFEVAKDYPGLLPLWLRPLAEMAPEAGAYRAELNEVIRGKIKDPTQTDVMVRLFAPADGEEFQANRLQAFVNHYGAAQGLKKAELSSIKVGSIGDQLVITTPNERYTLPQGPARMAETDALSKITTMIDTVAGEKGVNKPNLGSQLTEGYGSSILNQKLFTPQWTQEMSDAMGLDLQQVTPSQWSLAGRDGKLLFQGKLDDVKLELVRQSVDPDYFKAYLSTQGYTLRQTKDLVYQVLIPGTSQPLISGNSVQDILREMPELMPKLPSKIGPDLLVVTPGKRVDVVYSNNLASGSYKNLMQVADTYSSSAIINGKVSLHVGKTGMISADRLSKQLEVEIPEVGYRRLFNSNKDAMAYLKGGYESMENMTRIANVKGYDLRPMGGKFVLSTTGMSMKIDTLDGVKAVLRDVPIPSWAPELTGLTEDSLVGGILPEEGQFKPRSPLMPNSIPSKWTVLSQAVDAPGMWFERWVRKGGDEYLLSLYNKIETLRRITTGADHEAGQLLYTIHSPGGKLMSEERRMVVGEYLNASTTDKPLVATNRAMTTEELGVAEKMKQFYQGMKTKFGVDPQMFIDEYFPHLQKWRLDNANAMYSEGDVGKVLRDAFGPKPPAELDAFFKHWRVSDMFSTALEQDSLKAAMKYAAVGNRQLIQADTWKQAMDYLADGTKDEVMALRFKTYLNDVKGLPQSMFSVVMKQAALQDLVKIGVGEGPARNLIDTMMSLGYTAALGFSPGKAIRNTLDLFMTAAPRLGWDGNEVISQALKEINADAKGLIYNRLKASGDIANLQRLPTGQDFLREGTFGKVLKSGMAWYENSDELTRAIVYRAAEIKWERAYGRYADGLAGLKKPMSEDAFEEMSGLITLAPTKANELRQYIREGKWDVAKADYASKITEEGMFLFRGANSPLAFRGVVGKVFGMMGHYPVSYVENIRRAIMYGNTSTKLAFGATLALNCAALVGTMKALGASGNDYLPWNPVSFSGGPYYQMANTALQCLGRGYQGRQARAELLGISTDQTSPTGFKIDITKSTFARWLIPGSFQLLKMQKGLDYLQKGDDWSAWLSAVGFVPDPSQENQFSEQTSTNSTATPGG